MEITRIVGVLLLTCTISALDNVWNICQEGAIDFNQSPFLPSEDVIPYFKGVIYINATSHNMSKQVINLRDVDGAKEDNTSACACDVTAVDGNSFDVSYNTKDHSSLVVRRNCQEPSKGETCSDFLLIETYSGNASFKDTYDYENSWSKSEFMAKDKKSVYKMSVTYVRDLLNPPSVDQLFLELTASQRLKMICSQKIVNSPIIVNSIPPRHKNRKTTFIAIICIVGGIAFVMVIVIVASTACKQRNPSYYSPADETALSPIESRQKSKKTPKTEISVSSDSGQEEQWKARPKINTNSNASLDMSEGDNLDQSDADNLDTDSHKSHTSLNEEKKPIKTSKSNGRVKKVINKTSTKGFHSVPDYNLPEYYGITDTMLKRYLGNNKSLDTVASCDSNLQNSIESGLEGTSYATNEGASIVGSQSADTLASIPEDKSEHMLSPEYVDIQIHSAESVEV